jgi:hypothetical protein
VTARTFERHAVADAADAHIGDPKSGSIDRHEPVDVGRSARRAAAGRGASAVVLFPNTEQHPNTPEVS